MDNVTHSLLGIGLGEAMATARKKDRAPLWIASAIANNLPDLDVVWTRVFTHDRLGYMLYHRGYTHTLIMGPVQSALLLPFLWLWWRWRKRENVPWREVIFLVFLGPLTHILADSWNSYGVHPFWPWDNHWYYGDLVYILEPWIWAIFLPLCWARATRPTSRRFALLLLAGLIALSWWHPLAPWPLALALTLFSAAWVPAQKLFARMPGRRVLVAWGLFAFLLGSLWLAQSELRGRFTAEAKAGDEIALQPFPGNPFCWTAFTAGFSGDIYHATAWLEAPWPLLVNVQSCVDPWEASGRRRIGNVLISKEDPAQRGADSFTGQRADLAKISQDCRANAFLRFARIPFWEKSGDHWTLSDFRFPRGRGMSFAELESGGEDCPKHVPPWIGRFHPENGR